MYDIRPNVYALVKELEKRNGKDFEKQQLAKLIGITRPTLDSLLSQENKRDRIEFATMAKLLRFFHKAGIAVTLNDLFIISTDSDGPPYG